MEARFIAARSHEWPLYPGRKRTSAATDSWPPLRYGSCTREAAVDAALIVPTSSLATAASAVP